MNACPSKTANHVSTYKGFELCINRGVHNQLQQKRTGGKERKGKGEKKESCNLNSYELFDKFVYFSKIYRHEWIPMNETRNGGIEICDTHRYFMR